MDDLLTLDIGDRFQIEIFKKKPLKSAPVVVTWRVVRVWEKYLPDGTPDFSYLTVDDDDPRGEELDYAFWFDDVNLRDHRKNNRFQLVGTATDPEQAKTQNGGNDNDNAEQQHAEPGLFEHSIEGGQF
jgi:hypothetical protein